ncbi:alpha/beta fold hydrolase [Methylocapsa acidiphila]|uniref:alpha/beta fold hydrolase n=1 Tax=Methylocapsa acidiphila TaxID=133552 RepID=UPI00040D8CAE|nr:alpha/beta hydrolase [Methylocapsa acidiphila]
MDLRSTADNPVPPDAAVAWMRTRDKLTLRAACWTSGPAARGTVAILPGRAEFIEKYFEVIGELITRNFDVAILDWRGQGLSDRLLGNRRKGHVRRFGDYEADLDALQDEVLAPFCRKPWFALGHSMGGAIALAQARAGRSPFDRIVATAPMIDLKGLRFPRMSRFLARALSLCGFKTAFVPGGGGRPYMSSGFQGNLLTSDPERHVRFASILDFAPELGIGDPTIGWVDGAFRLMRGFEDAEFPRRILTPTLIMAAGDDKIVDTVATETFAGRLKAGRFITLPHARHEILMERDAFREQFWAAFDAFVPGQDEPKQRRIRAAGDQRASA